MTIRDECQSGVGFCVILPCRCHGGGRILGPDKFSSKVGERHARGCLPQTDDAVGARGRARRADDARARAHRHQVRAVRPRRRQGRDGGRQRAARQEPRQVPADGRRPAPAADAGEADAGRLLPLPLRLHLAPAAERHARAEGRPPREGDPRLPAARHRRRQLHPLRPRLLGRADDRALCRRGGELGGEDAPGAALLPRRVGRLRLSRRCT